MFKFGKHNPLIEVHILNSEFREMEEKPIDMEITTARLDNELFVSFLKEILNRYKSDD